jgi:hypothetical protein
MLTSDCQARNLKMVSANSVRNLAPHHPKAIVGFIIEMI